MPFPSETTKKERRNLLAAALAGLVIAKLQLFPTQLDALGMRFSSQELPFVAVGTIELVLTYFLMKFSSSYLYEWAQAESERLAAQIREGKAAMDIAHEESLLKEKSLALLERRRVAQEQQTHENNRLATMEENVHLHVSSFENDLNSKKAQLATINKKLALLGEPSNHESNINSRQRQQLQDGIQSLKKQLEDVQKRIEEARQRGIADLSHERSRVSGLYEAAVREQNILEKEILEKTESIAEWKRTHKASRIVSPLHNFLELVVPLAMGVLAIIFLAWLMFHPPASKQIALPFI